MFNILLSTLATQAVTEASAAQTEDYFKSAAAAVLIFIFLAAAVICIVAAARYGGRDKKDELPVRTAGEAVPDNGLTKRSTVSVILVACSGYMSGRMFTFRRELLIGRDSSVCTVVYPQKIQGISGMHCRLYVESGGVYLADLGSAAGTFLEDGERVVPRFPIRLTAGMKFYVGTADNMFEVRL